MRRLAALVSLALSACTAAPDDVVRVNGKCMMVRTWPGYTYAEVRSLPDKACKP